MIRPLSIICLLLATLSTPALAGGPRAAKSTKTVKEHKSAGVLAGVFGRMASKSGERALHAKGEAFHASLLTPGGKRKSAVVRVSRAGATKPGSKDILGLAIKVHESSGKSQDFLLVGTLGNKGLGARVPWVYNSLSGQKVSSLTSFSKGGAFGTKGISGPITATLPEGFRSNLDLKAPGLNAMPLSFQLSLQNASFLSRLGGTIPSLSLGEVTVHFDRPLSAKQQADLNMTPFHTAQGIKPIGWLNGLREDVYVASQAGRKK